MHKQLSCLEPRSPSLGLQTCPNYRVAQRFADVLVCPVSEVTFRVLPLCIIQPEVRTQIRRTRSVEQASVETGKRKLPLSVSAAKMMPGGRVWDVFNASQTARPVLLYSREAHCTVFEGQPLREAPCLHNWLCGFRCPGLSALFSPLSIFHMSVLLFGRQEPRRRRC